MSVRAVLIVAVLLFAASLIGYAATLAPGVLGGDAGEMQFVPYICSLAHPTGYPLQTLLNKTWITVVPWGSVAWRTNLLSSCVAALGISLVYVTVCRMTFTGSIAGLTAALALAIAPLYWGQAVLGDKYALNGLLTAGLLWCAWRLYAQPDIRSLVGLAFAGGLGLAHHRSFLAFGLPLAALVAVKGWRLFRRTSSWVAVSAALAGPLLLYVYVPLAAARGLPPCHARITSWAHFVEFLLDVGYLEKVYLLPQGSDVRYYFATFLANFGPVVLLFAASGLIIRCLRQPSQRGWVVFLLTGFLLQSYLTQNYAVPRRFVFFIPAYVCAAVLIGEGVAGWLELVRSVEGRFLRRAPSFARNWVAIVLVILPLSRLPHQWRVQWAEQRVAQPMDIWRQDLKTGRQADRLAAALELVEPRALVVGDWEQATPLWYAQQVEGICPDCLILSGMHRMIDFAARALAEERPLYVARTLNQAADWSAPTAVGPLVYLAPAPETRLPDDLIPLDVVFDGRVQLAGYTWPLGRPTPRPGTVLPISLVWRLADPPAPNFAIALRLTGPAGEVWKADVPAPVLGMHPFGRLQVGQVVADYYEVPIPTDAPVGSYVFQVLLYEVLATGGFENAPITDTTGRALGGTATVMEFILASSR